MPIGASAWSTGLSGSETTRSYEDFPTHLDYWKYRSYWAGIIRDGSSNWR